MAYIKFRIDGTDYNVYLGKISGFNLASNGAADPLIFRPTIQYFGDILNKVLPMNRAWNSISIVKANGTLQSLTITHTVKYKLEKCTGLMTNDSFTLNNTTTMPAVYTEIDCYDIKQGSNVLFSYSPQLTNEYECYMIFDTKPSGTNIPLQGFLQYCPNYMIFNIENSIGAYSRKNGLMFSLPFTRVLSEINFSVVEKITKPAVAWAPYYQPFKVRLYWDKNVKILYANTTSPIFNDNTIVWNNNTWVNGTPFYNSYRESDCGKIIRTLFVTNNFNTIAPVHNTYITNSMDYYNTFLYDKTDETPPDNENEPPDTTGDRDETSDEIPFPTPVLNITDFVTIYNFKQNQLKTLSQNIWNNNFVDNILKVSNYALDCIICFNAYNFNIEISNDTLVRIGNVQFDLSAGQIENAYQELNMGTITIMPFFGDYRDYTNTNAYIYLPFIGMKQLDVEQIQGNKITLKYIIDVLSGECLAMIKISGDKINGVTQSFKGKCNYSIPLGGENYSRLNTDIAHGVLTKSLTGFIGGTISAFERAKQVSIGNNLGGNIALANVLTPYILFERYDTLNPISFSQWQKWNSYYMAQLNTVTGLTKANIFNINIPLAQENEIEEIKQLLQQGVVF